MADKTEFRVGGWAMGVIPDKEKRTNQCILCQVKSIEPHRAIVAELSGVEHDTSRSDRKWFAVANRDDGCARLWKLGKTQFRHYWSMLGILSKAQNIAVGGSNAPKATTIAPKAQKPVSDAPTPAIEPVARAVQPQTHETRSDDDKLADFIASKDEFIRQGVLTLKEYEALLAKIEYGLMMGTPFDEIA